MPRSRRVHRTAYTAFELAAQNGHSAIAAWNIAALLQPFLHIIKKPRADNRLVVFFDIVLRKFSLVFLQLPCQEVYGKLLL